MEVIKISPRGYCYGVVDALQLVRQTAKNPTVPRPIYILYIGKKGHHEPEGVLGEVPGHISLIEDEADVDALELTPAQQEKLAVSTQTTLSQWDTRRVIAFIKNRYPQAEVHIDICAATQTRQEAVVAQARGADLTIVVGDPRSNNTNRLVQVSEELAGVPAVRIEDLSQLKPAWLKGKKRVAVTAGASTPSQLTREVIRYLEQYQPEIEQ